MKVPPRKGRVTSAAAASSARFTSAKLSFAPTTCTAEACQAFSRESQRVSLRALDPELSQPWEPIATCTAPQPVSVGEVVAIDVALGPSATLFRAGEQLRLVVAGRWLCPRNPLTGQFPAAYPNPPRGRVTLHWGSRHDAHLLIPEIPGERS